MILNEGLMKAGRADGPEELWIEIGKRRWCPNNCKYCFSEMTEEEPLSAEKVIDILQQFKEGGGKAVGVPGAGEPFHPKSIEVLFKIMEFCSENSIKCTVFTEGSLITEEIADAVKKLSAVRLLVKCNSRNPTVQDELVGRVGYTSAREQTLQMLIAKGFANPDETRSRIGIVTSIMTENIEEIPDLLRFARKNGLIFDCDTLIYRGKGGSCGLQPTDDQLRAVISKLVRIDKREFNRTSPSVASSYVLGPACTRFKRHLYIGQNGIVHPCVGTAGVVLGDIKTQSLTDIWNGEITKIIRAHKYVGPCTSCNNYKEEKCFSCLGRRAPNLTTEKIKKMGAVPLESTCFNFKSCSSSCGGCKKKKAINQ